jgi:O-antigen/teichoic acid export membrane protein
MLNKILNLGKETATYGLSTIVGRLLNFLIVPFYANVLLPSENGIIANIYAYIAFGFVIYCYGMEAAYMRFVSSLEIGDKRQNFSVPFLSLFATSIILSIAVHLNSLHIAEVLGIEAKYAGFIRYAGWILCFDTLTVVPFASLRMEHRAKRFALLKLFNISVNLVLNLVLILGFKMNAEGVFLANLLASGATFLLMAGMISKNLTFRLPLRLYREILKFGIPYIPAGLAGIAMQVVDRPIVKALTNDATLGIYQLNYKLGIFMMLVVGMFDYAWRPFFLNHAKDPDARQLFSKVFTYYAIASAGILIIVSVFIEDVVRVKILGRQFFPPVYWDGVQIVPWILLAYVFMGAYVIFIVGVYLEKKTKYLPFLSGTGAALNICANYWLIPKIGILGAAISTLLSYVLMASGMYFVSQKYYRVGYEWRKIMRVAGMTAVVFAVYKWADIAPLHVAGIIEKLLLIIAFTAGLMIFRVVDFTEINALKKLVKRFITGKTDTAELPE